MKIFNNESKGNQQMPKLNIYEDELYPYYNVWPQTNNAYISDDTFDVTEEEFKQAIRWSNQMDEIQDKLEALYDKYHKKENF